MFESLKFYQRRNSEGPSFPPILLMKKFRPIEGRYLPTCEFFSFTFPRNGATHMAGSERGQLNDCMMWRGRTINEVPDS